MNTDVNGRSSSIRLLGQGGEFGEGVRKPCGGVEAVELCGAKQGLNGGGTLAGTF